MDQQDPLDEQLRQIRAQKEAKFEADKAAKETAKGEDASPTNSNVEQKVCTKQDFPPTFSDPWNKPPNLQTRQRTKLNSDYLNRVLGNALSTVLGNMNGTRTNVSSDLDDAIRISKQTAEADALENQLINRNLKIEVVENDGNCLFLAASLQIVGSKEGHADLRAAVVAHMIENRERYEPFATEEFDVYIAAMSCLGEYGTNLEIQAISELQSRPVEVYSDESGANPMNIFQGTHYNPNPIRLSYHRGNHYNAVLPITSEQDVVPPTSFGVFEEKKK